MYTHKGSRKHNTMAFAEWNSGLGLLERTVSLKLPTKDEVKEDRALNAINRYPDLNELANEIVRIYGKSIGGNELDLNGNAKTRKFTCQTIVNIYWQAQKNVAEMGNYYWIGDRDPRKMNVGYFEYHLRIMSFNAEPEEKIREYFAFAKYFIDIKHITILNNVPKRKRKSGDVQKMNNQALRRLEEAIAEGKRVGKDIQRGGLQLSFRTNH